MLLDRCTCIRCGDTFEIDTPLKSGTVLRCESCASNMTVGKLYGQFYENVFKRAVNRPPCPACKGSDSRKGKQVLLGSMDLFLRQCNACHAVWIGNSWYME